MKTRWETEIKPRYRYAICDNGTEFLFPFNHAAEKHSGGFFKRRGEEWTSANDYKEELHDYVATYYSSKKKKQGWFKRLLRMTGFK